MSADPRLTSMNVSLPVSQKEYVRARAGASGCSTPSEYVRRLIHADQEHQAQARLDELLLAGLNSSPGVEMTPEDWADIRQDLARRLAARRTAE